MLQLDPFGQLSCPNYSLDELINYGVAIDDNQIDSFFPCFTSSYDHSFETSHANYNSLPDDVENFPFHDNDFPMDFSSFDSEDLKDLFEVDVSAALILPTEEMEIDNEVGTSHLAKAYAEAMENEEKKLAEVIVRRINDKVSPIGDVRERLLYHSFQPLDHKQAENNYLKQEASKVFDKAFEAIYQMIPNGMFAHFRANMAILEALPCDNLELLHVVDFDMGDGVQWPSLIMAMVRQQNLLQQVHGVSCQQRKLKLTSIKWEEEDDDHESSRWIFGEAKSLLQDYAYSHGWKLRVEEIELQDLVSEVKKMKKNRGKKEWVAFNCMHALPHMGRRRSKRHVIEFLNVAKDFLSYCDNNETSHNRGVITYGDGENWMKIRNCSCFGSFFESYIDHYQALIESMELNFPKRLGKARIALECLFVAPFVDSFALLEEWKEVKEVGDFGIGFGLLKEMRFSKESLMEAKVMVKEGESLYGVRIEGENENEMVLEWRGTPLVRVCTWR